MKRGLTFIEILMVLFIMSILLIMVSPTLTSHQMESVQSRLFLNQLMNEINYAKDLAVTENRNVCLEFDVDNQRIFYLRDASEEKYELINLPDGLQLMSDFYFCYFPDGSINAFRTVYFQQLTTQKKYALVFQLGSGKFYLKGES